MIKISEKILEQVINIMAKVPSKASCGNSSIAIIVLAQ